ncbi:MAG: hypothetical protein H6541_01270 [Lentimicrobiaceae bacterium]|nr:hypothetical protein [Lentimicrobiaceae bacterium]MCB9023039.1 hypothetical protein [Lentimicrobiaceae bacterium]MCO5264563.1 hypothetical protein [Lentimicrobium sp.]
MKQPIKLIILLLAFLSLPQAKAQYYDIGQARASHQWKQIETPGFRLIFPSHYEPEAQKAAVLFEYARNKVSSGLQANVRKTPLIFHTESEVSNAYSIWAPRRIEFLTTPPQDLYPQPWIEQLALHEYRHIAQLSKLNQGITKSLGIVFGEQAVVVSTGLFVPSWFIEGDAVVAETALGKSGRGRVPAFEMPLRAQLKEKGTYSYAKASLGSYKDFVPDIYITGYHIVAAARKKYGNNLWNTALNFTARRPYTITPFNNGLKKVSGLNKKGIYLESMVYLDSLWHKGQATESHQIKLLHEPDNYTNYNHPHFINDTLIVALKTSYKDIPRIVSIDKKGREQIIYTPGYMPDDRISYSGGWLAWIENRPHVRWETVGFTTIIMLNPTTGELRKLKTSDRNFSPVAAPNGKDIAVITIGTLGESYLKIIKSDQKTESIPFPAGLFAASLQWSPDGKQIIFILTGNKGKALACASPGKTDIHFLTPFSYSEISNPAFADDLIFFSGTFSGKSQIFKLNPATKSLFVCTNEPFGATQASIAQHQMLYATYTADGYRIANVDLTKSNEFAYEPEKAPEFPLAEILSEQENHFSFPDSITTSPYKAKTYKKGLNLFGIHSWAPVFVDIGGETVRPGISVMSQNLLSTLSISAGYDYNMDEKEGMIRSEITWKGWFPVFSAKFSTGKRASMTNEQNETPRRFTWNETNFDFSISQSLNLSRGPYSTGLFAEISHNLTHLEHDVSTPIEFTKGDLSGLTYRTFFYHYKRQAYRDLAPQKGFNLELKYRHTPFGQIKAGNIAAVAAQVYLPGLAANHSFQIYSGFQQSNPETYRFANIISVSRGYLIIPNADKVSSLKAIYRLPLFYPDRHLGGLLFIKRIRAAAFYDFTSALSSGKTTYYNSAGADLTSDIHLLGLSTPVSLGIRTMYLLNSKQTAFELLFSMNLYQY